MLCIICREPQEKMSDEHVIPDSIGGFYHIYNVCIVCNSKLGELVDSPLVNHKLTDLYRFSQNIKGKSGKIPNPFSGTIFYSEEDPEIKARIDIRNERDIKIKYHPIVKVKEVNGFVESIKIEVNKENEGDIDTLIKKITKRKGIPESDIVKSEFRREIRTGGVGGTWEIDTLKFKIGLLKIAYEFAVDSIPEYYSDRKSVEISKVLKDANYEEVNKYAIIGNGLDAKIFEPFKDYLDFESKNHYLILTESNYGLLCLVKLHNLFCVGIVLSDKNYLNFNDTIFGVNDTKNREFNKYKFSDVVEKCIPSHYHFRFIYHLRNEVEAKEFNAPDYRYEVNEKFGIPLYRYNGERYPFLVQELLKRSPFKQFRHEDSVITRCYFDSDSKYFVKAMDTGKLYQVVAAEIIYKQVRKI
ncbi:TPA: hypothetical protein N2782_002940 [Vibrio parahaemolyticus]|nr:hypothetical protein [Vibrio parahaemolyticus]